MMILHVANGLINFHEKGIAVIKSDHGDMIDCKEIAAEIINVLTRLKCSFDHYYNDVEDSYFIIDNMNEVTK